jgi:metal-sulfur cluster biosynthetic enzyme
MIDEERVRAALSTVRDPELDESLTELGFVDRIEIRGASVSARLRLPTYFCAPNFAYLMASDARDAIAGVAGVRGVEVELIDHFVSDEVNEGLARNRDFGQTFPDDATDEGLDDLRELFRRKAFLARQGRLARTLTKQGMTEQDLANLEIGELPRSDDTRLYLERRAELGLDTSDGARFLVSAAGEPVAPGTEHDHLRFAQTVSASIDVNTGMCRGLLETRYGIGKREEVRT